MRCGGMGWWEGRSDQKLIHRAEGKKQMTDGGSDDTLKVLASWQWQ